MNHEGTKDAKSTKIAKRFEKDTVGDRWSSLVTGAAIDVHQALGPGFLESVYEAALCIELEEQGIPLVRQAPTAVRYKGHTVGEGVIDVLVAGTPVVELKTVEAFAPIHVAQVMSYLEAIDQPVGLLINFRQAILSQGGLKRVLRSSS